MQRVQRVQVPRAGCSPRRYLLARRAMLHCSDELQRGVGGPRPGWFVCSGWFGIRSFDTCCRVCRLRMCIPAASVVICCWGPVQPRARSARHGCGLALHMVPPGWHHRAVVSHGALLALLQGAWGCGWVVSGTVYRRRLWPVYNYVFVVVVVVVLVRCVLLLFAPFPVVAASAARNCGCCGWRGPERV